MKKILLFVFAVIPAIAFADVCDKLIYPEIVHRPRCTDFAQGQCKKYDPIKYCEDLVGNGIQGKTTACCWRGMQPNEIGGRGGKGNPRGNKGSEGKGVKSTPKSPVVKKAPVAKNEKGSVTEKVASKNAK